MLLCGYKSAAHARYDAAIQDALACSSTARSSGCRQVHLTCLVLHHDSKCTLTKQVLTVLFICGFSHASANNSSAAMQQHHHNNSSTVSTVLRALRPTQSLDGTCSMNTVTL